MAYDGRSVRCSWVLVFTTVFTTVFTAGSGHCAVAYDGRIYVLGGADRRGQKLRWVDRCLVEQESSVRCSWVLVFTTVFTTVDALLSKRVVCVVRGCWSLLLSLLL